MPVPKRLFVCPDVPESICSVVMARSGKQARKLIRAELGYAGMRTDIRLRLYEVPAHSQTMARYPPYAYGIR